jgi:hypothetical protein
MLGDNFNLLELLFGADSECGAVLLERGAPFRLEPDLRLSELTIFILQHNNHSQFVMQHCVTVDASHD